MDVRTTITIPESTHKQLRRKAAEEGTSFKDAVVQALNRGLEPAAPPRKKFKTRTVSLGKPLVPLDHTLRLLGELDEIEYQRKRDTGK